VKWKEQEAPPAGSTEMPPTRELFKTMWEVDQSWLPAIRDLCGDAELAGKSVTRLFSLKDIEVFMASVR